MQSIIKLKNPILIDGKSVSEITYDTNEITSQLYAEADTKRRVAAGVKNVTIVPAAEFDFALYPYVGFAAAIAVNPGYTFEDMARVKGADLMAFASVGRDFLLGSEESPQSGSDNVSETTPEPSTPASQNSNESQ